MSLAPCPTSTPRMWEQDGGAPAPWWWDRNTSPHISPLISPHHTWPVTQSGSHSGGVEPLLPETCTNIIKCFAFRYGIWTSIIKDKDNMLYIIVVYHLFLCYCWCYCYCGILNCFTYYTFFLNSPRKPSYPSCLLTVQYSTSPSGYCW